MFASNNRSANAYQKSLSSSIHPFFRSLQGQKFNSFIPALYDMTSAPENASIVRFSTDGTMVEIVDDVLFCERVLPKYFKHKNFSSFIRQLNMYNFIKCESQGEVAKHIFRHDFFRRGNAEDLIFVKRRSVVKHARPTTIQVRESQQIDLDFKKMRETPTVDEHLEQIRLLRAENLQLKSQLEKEQVNKQQVNFLLAELLRQEYYLEQPPFHNKEFQGEDVNDVAWDDRILNDFCNYTTSTIE